MVVAATRRQRVGGGGEEEEEERRIAPREDETNTEVWIETTTTTTTIFLFLFSSSFASPLRVSFLLCLSSSPLSCADSTLTFFSTWATTNLLLLLSFRLSLLHYSILSLSLYLYLSLRKAVKTIENCHAQGRRRRKRNNNHGRSTQQEPKGNIIIYNICSGRLLRSRADPRMNHGDKEEKKKNKIGGSLYWLTVSR